MIGKYQFTVGDVTKEFEIKDNEGVLLFHFYNDGRLPQPLVLGNAQAQSVMEACMIGMSWIIESSKAKDNGQEEQNPSEG